MPIYEYKCERCGIIPIHQKIKDKELKKCPACYSKVRKLISAGYFYFNHHLKH